MAAVTQTPRNVDAITRDEAARILSVHVGTVDRLIRHGDLTAGASTPPLSCPDSRSSSWR